MTAETVILSPALVARDATVVVDPMLLRALRLVDRDPDFEDSVAAGYVETDVDAWYAQLGRTT